jgi:hypothetical protein
LDDHIYFSAAGLKLREAGFLLGIEENLGLYQAEKIRFQTFIHPNQHVVITLEESHQNKIESCHMYCVMTLKSGINPNDFVYKHPFCNSLNPRFLNTIKHFSNLDSTNLHSPKLESSSFHDIWATYLYYTDHVLFTKWMIKPDLVHILGRKVRECDRIFFGSRERLLKNIQILDLDPLDFGIKV